MLFNERLRQLRIEKNMTQQDLSCEISIGRASVSKYESGLMFPGYDVLVSLCSFFDVTSDYLLGLSDIREHHTQELINDDEKTSLNYYRRLSRESQDIIKGRMVELYREECSQSNEQYSKQKTG